MNNQINIPLPQISDFPYLNDFFLDRFGKVYMPDMSRAEIKTCQDYYRRHNRAPSGASELAFLNALAQKKRRDPNTFLISEMKTDDAFLAETFADLMAKRAAVTPDYQTPCSLAEILRVAKKYLAHMPKEKDPLGKLALSAAPASALTLSAKKIPPTLLCGKAEQGFAGGLLPSHALTYTAPLAENDTVYALLKSVDPIDDYEARLLAFATSPIAQKNAKRLYPIGQEGVLGALASLGMGFEADLVRLYGEKPPATRLLEQESGLLIAAKESEAAPLLMLALDMGLRPRLVGTLRKDPRILLREGSGSLLRFSLHFLETFVFSRAYRAELFAPPTCAYPSISTEEASHTLGDQKLFVSRADGDGSRLASLYASLHTVAACVARGASPRDIRVAERFALSLEDTSPKALGDRLSLLLGYYRAMTEFELTSLDTAMLTEENAPAFSLCAVCREPENPTPLKLISQSSRIYLLQPLYDENGNPDFDDIKKMFEYVGKLKQDDKILSARAVVGDILPTLEKMSEHCLVEYLSDAPRHAFAGSILIETKEETCGILLATTHVPEMPETAE